MAEAAESLSGVLETRIVERGFDFSNDYVVLNELGRTLLDLAQRFQHRDADQYESYLNQSRDQFLKVLELDPENAMAHANLTTIYSLAGDSDAQARHSRLHKRYKLDDNAKDVALPKARQQYPAANHAAEALVI